MSKAVVLLSGGLDSLTVLAMARSRGHECYALSFDYGQKHAAELAAASRIAGAYEVARHEIVQIPTALFAGSALTDSSVEVPPEGGEGIPVTYVPARNTVFLSFALAWAEVLEAERIFIGVNALDYSGYPDCRPEFIEAFGKLAALATRAGVQGRGVAIEAPLVNLSKSEIIQSGASLGVDYAMSVSCYSADDQGAACGRCDACRFRKRGFEEAGIADPTRYV